MAQDWIDETPATQDSLCDELQTAVNETLASHPHCSAVISEYCGRILDQIAGVQRDVIDGRELDKIRWEIHRLRDRAAGVTKRRRIMGNLSFPRESSSPLFD
jgi:hypothetical protein